MEGFSEPQKFSKDDLLHAEREYKIALFKTATKAAKIIEDSIDPNKKTYENLEREQIDLSVKFLSIAQGIHIP